METQINEQVAVKVLDTVRHGLVAGIGAPEPGKMCVEAAVCYALGLPHGDEPVCVSLALRRFKIVLNDASWSSTAARAKGLERLALAQLGSNKDFNDCEFARRVAGAAKAKWAAKWAEAEAEAAKAAKWAAKAAKWAAAEAAAAKAAKWSAEAAKWAAAEAAAAAKWSAEAAAEAAEAAKWSAEAAAEAAEAAKWSAAAAAKAAAAAAKAAEAEAEEAAKWSEAAEAKVAKWSAEAAAEAEAYDKTLSDCAEDVVQILIEMKAPGCQWLYLTETKQ